MQECTKGPWLPHTRPGSGRRGFSGASRLIHNGQHGREERPPVRCYGDFVRPNHPPDEFESSRRYYPHHQSPSGKYTGGLNKVRRSHTNPCRPPYHFRPVHAKLLPPRPPVIQPAPQKKNVASDRHTHEPNSFWNSLSSPRVCAGRSFRNPLQPPKPGKSRLWSTLDPAESALTPPQTKNLTWECISFAQSSKTLSSQRWGLGKRAST